MACCQSLNIVKGKIIGDTIEEKMFQATKFKLIERSSKENSKVGESESNEFYDIVPTKEHKRQFKLPFNFIYKVRRVIEFTSERKMMSNIIQNDDKNGETFTLLCKGAPEVIKPLCKLSTIPKDFED